MVLMLGFVIGIAAGLRSLAPVAIVAWAAQLRWPQVRQTGLSFMASPLAAYILTAFACVELVFDKLPFTPSRLDAGPLGARILMGGLAAATLCAATHESAVVGAIVGALGGVVGAFAGYRVRRHLTMNLKAPDLLVALGEDIVTICIAVFVVTRF